MFFLAISPILLLIVLLLFAKWNLAKASPVVFIFTLFLVLIAWNLSFQAAISATLKGALLALDIIIIVFGAISFVAFLKHIGTLSSMQQQLASLSKDHRVQAILLAWLLGSFIEGISGFGTAGVIVAPFLVSIGFKPLTTILISLLANCTAVTFGAVGTPVRIGLAEYVDTDFIYQAAFINFFAGFFVPLFILFLVVRESKLGRAKSFKEAFPWAIFSGTAFLVPYLFFSRFGSDYPSVFGGALGLLIAVWALSRGYFSFDAKTKTSLSLLAKTFGPYGFLLLLLILGKVIFNVSYKMDLGSGLHHNIQLFNPGFGFITVILFISVIRKISWRELASIGKHTLIPLKKTFLSIFFIGSVTYLLVVTGMSSDLRPGILQTISQTLIGPLLPYYSAFIGAFGSFLAGSATVSNLLFGHIQAEAAQRLGLSLPLILSLQLTGAAAGNMIALPNILALQAAVGEENHERKVLSVLFWPCTAYLLISTAFAIFMNKFWF